MNYYNFLKDQGSFIAGLLALMAGLLANTAEKRAAQRELARQELIAVQLTSMIVRRILEDLQRLQGPQEDPTPWDEILLSESDLDARRRTVRKVPLEVIWNSLGHLQPEMVDKYLSLDTGIEDFWATRSPSGIALEALNRLEMVAKELETELADWIER